MPTGRVCIALDDPALEPTPVWTRIDNIANLVKGIDIHRGRQTAFDVTETSTATVYLNDTDALFDPDNNTSPYFGKLDGKQIALSLWNPVTSTWVQQFRGWIDDYGFDIHPAEILTNVQIECVGIFNYLAGVEMLPGIHGDYPVPVGSEGIVWYEDSSVQTRMETLLADAFGDGIVSAAWSRVFTGNVDVQEGKYDPGDAFLIALRDAADAEFPTIANFYEDKRGFAIFHGRYARFTPEAVAASTGGDWDFTRWKAAHGLVAESDPTYAQIRPPLRWSRPRQRIINAALAYPRAPIAGIGGGEFTEADMPDQVTINTTSIDDYGYHSWSAPDLITLAGTTTGFTAKAETAMFAEHMVANFKDPRTWVEALTFKSIRPTDPRATATWALLCGADISDIVELIVSYPGGGPGIDEDLYIEGSDMTIRPLNPTHDMVELTLNVSPATYYEVQVFS